MFDNTSISSREYLVIAVAPELVKHSLIPLPSVHQWIHSHSPSLVHFLSQIVSSPTPEKYMSFQAPDHVFAFGENATLFHEEHGSKAVDIEQI